MRHWIRCHPFPVRATLEHSVVLTHAVDCKVLEALVPAPLALDTYDDRLGFVALAMVKTRRLRPAAFPTWMGRDFILIGYRVFVRYTTSTGRTLRGLYVLRSDTNRRTMKWLGDFFTLYKYRHTDVRWVENGAETVIQSRRSDLVVDVDAVQQEPPLPSGSPFPDWSTARKFSGPMPYTFSVLSNGTVVSVRGRRADWNPRPLRVTQAESGFLETSTFPGATLANAFSVRDVSYRWDRGVLEGPMGR